MPAFTIAILGLSLYDGISQKLVRYPPEAHPRWPRMFARTVEFTRELSEPAVDVAGALVWTGDVEVAVGYEATPGVRWGREDDRPPGVAHEAWRWVERRREWDVVALPIPKRLLVFAFDITVLVPEPGSRITPSGLHVMKWLNVPATVDGQGVPQLPGTLEANLAACVGRVNSVTFDGRFPPRTALMLAPKQELVPQSDGSASWNLEYHFAIRGGRDLTGAAFQNVGTPDPAWDRLVRADGQYWRVVRKDDVTKSIYDTVDLHTAFRVDAV
jgi:hypothetical protein